MSDWDQWKAAASGKPEAVKMWHDIIEEGRDDESRWMDKMRALGAVGAHPDDGWVDRARNRVQFVYPQFLDKELAPGDFVALGWPHQYRIVMLVKKYVGKIFSEVMKWSFEEVVTEGA